MTSSWQPQSFEPSSSNKSSPFDSLPYPYPPEPPFSSSLGVPQQPSSGVIRRARSSGALEIDTMRRPSFQSPWSANSPFSPSTSLPPPRDDTFPPFDYYRRTSSTTAYPLPDYPSPSDSSLDNPRRFHRRTSSAQPAFFLSESNSSSPGPFTPMNSFASGLSPESSRRTSFNYSFSTPASHRMQCQPSAEDVDKFLKDMNEMLGTDAMASLKSSSTTTQTPPQSNGLTLTSTSSPPSSSPRPGGRSQQTYNVSGVLLTEDEYRQYSHSEQTNLASNRPRQYFPSTSQQQYAPQPSPGYDLQRPRSAPPSPQVDPSGAFVPFHSPPSPPPPAPLGTQRSSHFHYAPPFTNSSSSSTGYVHPRPFHRRGSSVDATVPRTFVTTPSIPIEYGYASYPTTTNLTPSPTRSNLPVGYPPPYIPSPQYFNTPPHSTPVSRMFSSSSSTTTATTFNDEAPVSPVSPTRPKGSGKGGGVEGKYRYRTTSSNDASPTKARGGGGGKGATKGPISFINFSASDSKVLLSGVAPSGSSKKRGRDESAASSTTTTAKGNEESEGTGKKARN
ncbi:hypothetical protein JCM3765_002717 [Sporobolomyces pararoseus]